jgi:lipoprotein-anchoring transpeptidase ErfK/SrfK
MYRDTIPAKITASLLVFVLTAFSLAFAWAVVDDYVRRDILPSRASIDATSVSNMPRADSVALVEKTVKGKLLSPATVRFRDQSFTLDPAGYASVDVEGMVDAAMKPKADAWIIFRVLDRIAALPIGSDVPRKMRIDEAKLGAWIAEIDPKVATPAVDATYSVEATGLVIHEEIAGHRIDMTSAVPTVSKALLDGVKDVELPDQVIPAKVTKANFGYTIFVRLSQRRVWFYNSDTLVKTYPIAVGTGAYPTPQGVWKIINKRKYPSWSNPAPNGWGSSMPAYIGPGPGNPLGTRALDLDASGIRFHGTNKIGSIGTAASHGCMRMLRRDVEEFFELVPVGTRVIIVR